MEGSDFMKNKNSKRLLLAIIATIATSSTWAAHHFKVCYYNYSSSNISYNNNGGSVRWKDRGELKNSGILAANAGKCFLNIIDETIFRTDSISFYVHGKKISIVNPGFSKPYIMAQDADVDNLTRKKSHLIKNVKGGKENYNLNVFVMRDGSIVLSNSDNPEDQTNIIKPRALQ